MKTNRNLCLFTCAMILIITIVVVHAVYISYNLREHLDVDTHQASDKCKQGCAVTVADLLVVQLKIEENDKKIQAVRDGYKKDINALREELFAATNLIK